MNEWMNECLDPGWGRSTSEGEVGEEGRGGWRRRVWSKPGTGYTVQRLYSTLSCVHAFDPSKVDKHVFRVTLYYLSWVWEENPG